MSTASVSSGKQWERDVCALLRDELGVEAQRVLDESREGNHKGDIDLGGLPFVIQCKNYRKPRVWEALDEAEAAGLRQGAVPMAFVRKKGRNRHDPAREVVVMNLTQFLPMFAAWLAMAGMVSVDPSDSDTK